MEIKKFDKSKEETYRILCNIRLLCNTYLSVPYRQIFLDKMNENPILYIINDKDFTYDKIKNFYCWKDYFLYQPRQKSSKLIMVNKKDVLRTLKNVRISIINDNLTTKKYKLN